MTRQRISKPERLTSKLGLIVLFMLSPAVVRAQTANFGGDPLDSWRARMAERLDSDLSRAEAIALAGAQARATDDRPGNDTTSAPTDFISAPARAPHLPWTTTITQILQSEGLPASLVGVAAVESGFDPEALSPKGALGLWQLMPQTARRFGLAVNARRDDRLDPVKSTYAAASYLKDLYAQFGDWSLALAAYNAGEDRVQQALDRHGVRDFWTLSRRSALPEETRRYVSAVLAEMKRTTAVPSIIPDDLRHAGLKPVSQAVRKVSAPATIVFATPSAAPGTLTPADR